MNVQPPDWHSTEFRRLLAVKSALPHALLLRGPAGIGKLAFARALAKALLCESASTSEPACGACSACIWFEAASHPDFRQVEPAPADGEDEDGLRKTTISVEQIRALPDFINMSSHRGGTKAIVLHPTEALNVNAANALLKNLEEPPPSTVFLLVTHRPHQLLPTIRSRCQEIALKAPDRAVAAAWLSKHGVRDAEVALAHVGNAPLLALELNGTGYWSERKAFLRHLAAAELDVMHAAEAAVRCPNLHVLAWLQKWSYDIAYHQALGRVRYNPDHADAIARISVSATPLAVLRYHRELVKLQRFAQHPLNPRLFVEDLLLAYRDCLGPQSVAA